MAGDVSTTSEADSGAIGDVKSGEVLLGDLEEVRAKVERFQTRQQLVELPELKTKGEAVVSCYRYELTPHFTLCHKLWYPL